MIGSKSTFLTVKNCRYLFLESPNSRKCIFLKQKTINNFSVNSISIQTEKKEHIQGVMLQKLGYFSGRQLIPCITTKPMFHRLLSGYPLVKSPPQTAALKFSVLTVIDCRRPAVVSCSLSFRPLKGGIVSPEVAELFLNPISLPGFRIWYKPGSTSYCSSV